MIRRLTKSDHEVCFQLLKMQSAENLFIIGDIEAYGYDKDFQKLWGDFNENGELRAVLLKYQENYIPFARGSFDAKGFAEIIENDPTFSMMSGLKDITEKIEPHLNRKLKRKRQTYYAKCTRLQPSISNIDVSHVKQAKPDDAKALVELLMSIPEFSESVITVKRKRRGLEDGVSRSFFIMEDNKAVSTASTSAENSFSAMVTGVCTLEPYKKKGYATQCMAKLCKQLLDEEKELCLFYDNPEAGAIYKRIGFEDIGFWMLYTYEHVKAKN
ncbi:MULTISPECIES: GNAT family N-acetyltransferase [Bacillus]|uniref:GNAT family acetyltransferase n=2 Tax=Bacillus TaxID=1386 RepID=A0A0M5JHB0_9BACI|nr:MULTISPECIES: GNAT family N-acetyltransferase [Bacillus]ALC83539.1 GNAT family acetyltransferase [Bacillus gobiensis]MBP1082521.1 putative GNAT family acetyltransferase [Bacillus capparidis]MED1097245.1 GNAT family N-acetyltransferase [Bacillus capparidis]